MRAREFLTELRDRMYQYIRSIVPTWPEYVVQDWLYKGRGKNKNYNVKQHYSGMEASQAIRNEIIEMITDAGLSPNTNPWQLVPNMKFTMGMFQPLTKQKLIGRAGGTSDLGMGIPKDKERHATQAALIQKSGVSKEPAILIKTPQGYELLEGWHRTIQHFARYPDGYVGPAYVAVAQGKPGVAENMDHSRDGRAVEELKAALLAKQDQLQSATDDQVYDIIDRIMKRIARSHSISGQKLHDMWVDRYKQIPDTWVMNEDTEQKPVIIYTDYRGATIDDDIKKSLPVTQIPVDKLRLWEKHKSMQDPKVADWVTNKLLPELKQNGKLKPLLVWNNNGQFFVIDGNHRLIAYQEAGYKGNVPVQIVPDNMITVSDTVPGQQGVAENKQPGKPVVDAILKVMPLAQEIWFHGSRAIGRHRNDSDTDILVVVPDDLVGDKYLGVVRILQKLSSHFDNHDIQPTKAGTNIHRIAQEEGRLLWSKNQGVTENFADGKVKGKSRPGRVKRSGASCAGSVTDLRAKARKYGGERGKMYHWCANMKGGKKK